MRKHTTFTVLALFMLAGAASSANVGIVAEGENGQTTTKCYSVEERVKADFICGESGIKCQDYGTMGMMLCNMFGTGTNCVWEGSFWGFSTNTGNGWSFQNTKGISDVETEDGMLLGFKWQSGWGQSPNEEPGFCQVCDCPEIQRAPRRIPKILGMTITPKTPTATQKMTINFTDNETREQVEGVHVELFSGTPGMSAPLTETTSDGKGIAVLTLPDAGTYSMRATAHKYPHEYADIEVAPTTSTTTSTTSSTTTSTTSSTSTTTTTYKAPEHVLFDKTTTTVPATTSTQAQPAILGAATSEPKTGGGFLSWLLGLFT